MTGYLRFSTLLASIALVCVIFAAPGCSTGKKNEPDKGKEKAKDKDKTKDKDKDGHGHGETGPNRGGVIVEWEPYHAEVTIDPEAKMAIVYILDEKAEKAPAIEPARFTKVKLIVTSEKPNITVELTHDPKKSVPTGIAFTGTHDFFGKSGEFKGNLSGILDENAKAKSKPLTDDFEYDPKKHSGKKDKSTSMRELFLTPGGLYTAADIQANGNTTATEKYRGRKWTHGKNVEAGDRICPVTGKKADADCVWIVQGQRYEFCCHPCVAQFLRTAHQEPESIKDAKDYVHRPM